MLLIKASGLEKITGELLKEIELQFEYRTKPYAKVRSYC